MKSVRFLSHYIIWHFTGAFRDAFGIWKNFLWFVGHFFSISKLLKTLFSPWEKLNEEYGRGLSFEGTLGTFLVNMVVRLVGAVIRSAVIVVGVLVWIVVFVGGIAFFVLWLLLPLVILTLFVLGVRNLF